MFDPCLADGMSRRHFLQHISAAATLTTPAATWFLNTLRSNAAEVRRRGKAAILLFMEGGPATIDIWDLKPGQPTGGQFKPISTAAAGVQISEHLPLLAKQMNHLSIVRSMSTREADHQRGRYYMHTGYVPNPNIEYPSYGAVIGHELSGKTGHLDIPPFVSVGGPSIGPGFLGMNYAPLVVDSNGEVRNLKMSVDAGRLTQRMTALRGFERSFVDQSRGEAAGDHAKILNNTVNLMTSQQMSAFKVTNEPAAVLERYGAAAGTKGNNNRGVAFGKGCLMARRLVETGVPFVEVDLGGWDDHQDVFPKLKDRLPILDRGMSALVEDLNQRGMWKDTVVIWMGDFGRTPRINGRAGRDHWARSWSVVVGGGGIHGGQAVGKTNTDGTAVDSEPYTSQDLMASVLKALGISLETVFTSSNNRPMKIANSGRVIKELFA
jgi:uncharacterized protein (DUF1501 family)